MVSLYRWCDVLRVRVEDEELRRLVDELISQAAVLLGADSQREACKEYEKLGDLHNRASERFGTLLRETY